MASGTNNNYNFNNVSDGGVVANVDGELPDNTIWKHKIPNIEKDVLGIGSFGKVTLVEHEQTGSTYALKCVSKYRIVKTGQHEKRVLTMLDHHFV